MFKKLPANKLGFAQTKSTAVSLVDKYKGCIRQVVANHFLLGIYNQLVALFIFNYLLFQLFMAGSVMEYSGKIPRFVAVGTNIIPAAEWLGEVFETD